MFSENLREVYFFCLCLALSGRWVESHLILHKSSAALLASLHCVYVVGLRPVWSKVVVFIPEL